MQFTKSNRKQAALVVSSLVLVCLTAIALGTRSGEEKKIATMLPSYSSAGLHATHAVKDSTYKATQQMAVAQSATQRVEVEILTVTSNGFAPKVINRPPGPFFLLVDNRSGEELDALQLDPEGAPDTPVHLLQMVMHRDFSHSAQRIDLPPGSYVFKQAGRAGWSCRIVIDARLAHS